MLGKRIGLGKFLFISAIFLIAMAFSIASADSVPYQNTSNPYWHDTPIIDGRHIYGYVHPPYEHIPLISPTNTTPNEPAPIATPPTPSLLESYSNSDPNAPPRTIVSSPVMAINKNDILTCYKSQSVSTDTTIFDCADNGYPTIHRNTPISPPILQNRISPSFQNLNIQQTIGSFEIERERASEPVGELQYFQGLYLDPLSGVYYTFAVDDAGNTFSEPVRWISVRV
jgi:hypothetical protein